MQIVVHCASSCSLVVRWLRWFAASTLRSVSPNTRYKSLYTLYATSALLPAASNAELSKAIRSRYSSVAIAAAPSPVARPAIATAPFFPKSKKALPAFFIAWSTFFISASVCGANFFTLLCASSTPFLNFATSAVMVTFNVLSAMLHPLFTVVFVCCHKCPKSCRV